MKISKLFHWLYAILMLLPFAFFVPSVLYYAFNDNATMQSVEVPKTETISVDFNQQINNGDFDGLDNWYLYTGGSSTFSALNNELVIDFGGSSYPFKRIYQYISIVPQHKYLLKGALVCPYSTHTCKIFYSANVNNNYPSGLEFGGDLDYDTKSVILQENLDALYFGINIQLQSYADTSLYGYAKNIQLFDLTQMFGSGNEPTIAEFNNYFPNSYYPYTESELMQITYDTGETEQLVENTSIINYAWESIWDLPLFSWTKVTFVSVPFSYLTGIFGLGASNSLNYVFGYFVTISIVWLVFDLLLYVPMLAHNWIDKARIE